MLREKKHFLSINKKTLIATTIVLCYVLELPSPITIYGVQLIILAILASFILITKKITTFNKKSIVVTMSSMLIITIFTIFHSFYLEHQQLLIAQYCRVLLWISCSFIFFNYIKNMTKYELQKSITIIIWIMAIAVFIQFIAYQAFNYIIDYSLLLGSSTPSRIVFNVFRSSGITAEPAIHSGIMIGLISLHFILLQRISLTTIIALISIFITFSIAGIVMALFYIIVVFSIKLNLKKISIGIITLSIAIAFSYPYLTDRYTKFVNNQDGSNNTKIETIKNMVTKHEILIGGYGLTGKSITAPPFYEGLYDMTFWGTSIVIFGLPMGLLIDILGLITISRLRLKLRDKALIIISLLKITAPTFMFFNIFIVLIFAINYQYKNEKRKITI